MNKYFPCVRVRSSVSHKIVSQPQYVPMTTAYSVVVLIQSRPSGHETPFLPKS